MRVAIMQPYFYPYAGYYRLFEAVDVFVAYDCVQFPRRGWVHRNKLENANGEAQWLTLPLEKGERDKTRICDLVFPENAESLMEEQMRRFPCLSDLAKNQPELFELLTDFSISPANYLVRSLEWSSRHLGVTRPIIKSSSLGISESLKAQDRIIEIANQLNATHYINAPGGLDLYDKDVFSDSGIRLQFLSEHSGSFKSVLQRILCEDSSEITDEIQKNCELM